MGGACCWPCLLWPSTESCKVQGDRCIVPGADTRVQGRGQVPEVGVRSQLVETTRKVLVVKRPMPDLVSCRRTIRPPPSGCWRVEAGGS